MKIFNFEITYHRHNWNWQVIDEFKNEHGNWTIKLVKRCTSDGCKIGYFKDIVYLHCENEPKTYHLN